MRKVNLERNVMPESKEAIKGDKSQRLRLT